MRMRKMFSRQRKIKIGKKRYTLPSATTIIFAFLVIAFIIGAFWSFGGPGRGARGGAAPTPGSETETGFTGSAVVATINGQAISRDEFDSKVTDMGKMMGMATPVSQLFFLKGEVLQEIIGQDLQLQAAKTEGVSVSNDDIDKEENSEIEEAINQQWPKQEDLYKYLQTNNLSRQQLIDKIKQSKFTDPDALKQTLLLRKLEAKVEGGVQVTDQALADFYTTVHVAHILISPDALIKASATPPAGAASGAAQAKPKLTPAQADAQAKQKAEALLAQLNSGADFATLAKQNSNDPGSAVKGGDLGWVKHGEMVPEFDQAAFALQAGQLSGVVKSQFGYHIIKVLERKSSAPADFVKNKQLYMSQVGEQLKQQAWQAYLTKLHDAAQIVTIDPELKALDAMKTGQMDQVKILLAQAAQEDPNNMSARYQLAQLAQQGKDWPTAIQYLTEITKNPQTASDASIWVELGKVNGEAGDKAGELDAYKAASDRASAPTNENLTIHTMLEAQFKALGHPELVTQEEKWIADTQDTLKKQGGGPGGMPGGMPGGTFQIPAGGPSGPPPGPTG
jgi:parvulin-like peptidyl-prolyl isomerase